MTPLPSNNIISTKIAMTTIFLSVWLLIYWVPITFPQPVSSQISTGYDSSVAYPLYFTSPSSPPTSTSHLHARVINDNTDTTSYPGGILTYPEAVEVGAYLSAILNAPTSCVPQSPWTTFSSLNQYGWTQTRRQNQNPSSLGQSFVAMFQQLGFSTDPSVNLNIEWTHNHPSQPIPPTGKVYAATGGRYRNRFNPNIIIAQFNFGPDYQGRAETPPVTGADVVPLKQWSDVLFLQWADFCQNDPAKMKELKGIARTDIINAVPRRIVMQALTNTGKTLNWWAQGEVTYPVESDECQAILATPNGQGVVWFLSQHKQQLDGLRITGVTVFRNKEDTYMGQLQYPISLLFRIGPGTGTGSEAGGSGS